MGVLPEDRLRELLTTMGDRFTDEDVSFILGPESLLIPVPIKYVQLWGTI